ncbi:MAG TPA: hypothetical protein VFP80_07755 [Thermoanaerobaculia bacterium]|nr:hypothetical protein [Thermoanaerobaculia bacterium]
MIRKSDWQAVQDEMIAEDRRTLGEPPTAEEVLAYSRGELAPEEEARVRSLLVAYPELTLALTAPFPAEDGEDVPEEEVSRRWESFRAQVRPQEKDEKTGKVLPFWRASFALAATLALVFGGLLWHQSRPGPRMVGEVRELFAGGQRGGSSRPVTLDAGTPAVLMVPVYATGSFQGYRLKLVGANDRVLWRSGLLERPADDAFHIDVPGDWLDAGDYRVVLYGIQGTREQELDAYPLRVRGS